MELEGLSLVDLRLQAKKWGIKGVTGYRKQELLELLKEEQKKHPEDSEESGTKNPPSEATEKQKEEKKEMKAEAPITSVSEKAEGGKQEAEVVWHAERTAGERNYLDKSAKRWGNERTVSPERLSKEEEKRNAYNRKAMSRYNEKQQRREFIKKDVRRPEENRRPEDKEIRRPEENNFAERAPRYGTPLVNSPTEMEQLDSGEVRTGILEVLPEGYGFIRCDNYLPGEEDVYVSPALIRKYHLRTGDILEGNIRVRSQNEKFGALLYVKTVNGYSLDKVLQRPKFEQLTPIFPNERIRLETPGSGISMRMMDLISPIGKGQRGMIVSQPKTGKTTLLKQVAKAVKMNHPKMHIIVLLIDERPEEVTDIKESIMGHNVEIIYSTFDELPENHKRVSEMVIERAKRLVEHGEEVMILLDSITRLARAYNLTVQPSGRTLSGGLDPAALHMPKRFFGAARNMREGGSLTILATALVDTGSRMDDVVFEEFKGTGNMELVLDRALSEKRVFPAIDLPKSSTRREDLLLTQEEIEATFLMRKAFSGAKSEEAVERIIDMFRKTKNNQEFIQLVKKVKIV